MDLIVRCYQLGCIGFNIEKKFVGLCDEVKQKIDNKAIQIYEDNTATWFYIINNSKNNNMINIKQLLMYSFKI